MSHNQYTKTYRKPESRLVELKRKREAAVRCRKKIEEMIRKKRKQMADDGHTESKRLGVMEHELSLTKKEIEELDVSIAHFIKRFRKN